MVRAESLHTGWGNAPIPILVVKVLSRGTRDRDLGRKRRFDIDVAKIFADVRH